jgi:FHS family Na+ dependent glucose MFS transporter 1
LGEALKYTRTAAYCLSLLGLGLMDASFGPTLPWLAQRTSTEVGAAGVLFTVRSCGYVAGSLVTGRLYDRIPGHRVMGMALCGLATSLALVPSAPTLLILAAVLFASGAAAGALDVGANTLLAWIHGERVGPFMNALHLFFGIGALIAPVIVAQTFKLQLGAEWAYWAIAATEAGFMLMLIALPSPVLRVRQQKSETSLSHWSWPLIVLVSACLMAYVGLEVGFGGWIFTYATQKRSWPSELAAYLTAVFWGAFTLGRLASIPAMAYLSKRNDQRLGSSAGARRTLRQVLRTALTGATVSTAMLLIWNSEAMLWIGSAALGAFIGPIFPTLISLAEQRMKLSGSMTSLFLVGAGFGAMLFPWLIGLAMRWFGPGAMLPAISTNAAILVITYLALTRWLGQPPQELIRPDGYDA